MKKKHIFHREQCENRMRDSFTDMFNRLIVLSGTHAFEWSITICEGDRITKMTYSCRKDARKEFEKYKKLR